MKKELKILIVDDHPVTVEAYKNILMSADTSVYDLTIDTANNCDAAINKIEESTKETPYNILFLDVKLPPSSNGKITSGDELAVFAKKTLPKARVVILTMFNESHRIYNILKNADPDGLLIKSDLTSKEFLIALDTIINNPPYYSSTVTKFFRDQLANLGEILLDEIDRKVLFHLSKGVKMKDLEKHINLSLSALEKRKIRMKALLGVKKGTDIDLIKAAEKRGFVK